MKVSLYRGSELITWQRTKPTLLNKQRTHLLHHLGLSLRTDNAPNKDQEEADPTGMGGDDDSDVVGPCEEMGGMEEGAECGRGEEERGEAKEKILVVLSVRLKTMKSKYEILEIMESGVTYMLIYYV